MVDFMEEEAEDPRLYNIMVFNHRINSYERNCAIVTINVY